MPVVGLHAALQGKDPDKRLRHRNYQPRSAKR